MTLREAKRIYENLKKQYKENFELLHNNFQKLYAPYREKCLVPSGERKNIAHYWREFKEELRKNEEHILYVNREKLLNKKMISLRKVIENWELMKRVPSFRCAYARKCSRYGFKQKKEMFAVR